MSEYVETPADHDFTAFLSNLTPSRVLRDRDPITTIERKRLRFMRERIKVQEAVAVAREISFTESQLAVAARWAANNTKENTNG